MALPTDLYTTATAIGAREDLSDFIYNLSPVETPMIQLSGTSTATQRYHEWQTDALASPASNTALEGDDPALDPQTTTTQVGNHCQISEKAFGVSGTLEVTNKAGRDSSLAYAAAKAARVLKTDVDFAMTGLNVGSVAGGIGTARVSGSLESWLETNVDRGTGGTPGASGGFSGSTTTAATDCTVLRAFTQAQLDGVISSCWDNGAKPSVILLGAKQKAVLATFDGVGARRQDGASKTVTATVDTYVSHFGTLNTLPSRHIRKTAGVDRNVFVIDPEHHKVSYLRSWQQYDLAKTGDSMKRQLLVEFTEEVCTEVAHGIIADLS